MPLVVFKLRLIGFWGIVESVIDSIFESLSGVFSKYIKDAAPILSMFEPYGARFK